MQLAQHAACRNDTNIYLNTTNSIVATNGTFTSNFYILRNIQILGSEQEGK